MVGLGFGMGMVDVSMNAHATAYEMMSKTHCMGLFHANYAVGSFLGAVIGGVFANADISPLRNFLLVSFISLPFSILGYFWLMGKTEEAHILKAFQVDGAVGLDASATAGYVGVATSEVSADASVDQPSDICAASGDASKDSYFNIRSHKFQLTCLCAIAFVSSLGEGSINDWSTIYFVETLGSSQLLAAFGFACFEVMVAIGRLYSDYLLDQYDGKMLLGCAGWMACIGLFLVVVSPYFGGNKKVLKLISKVGLAGCGAGMSIC
jgi:MFS family permease